MAETLVATPMVIFIIIVGLAFYLLPTIVACIRRKTNTVAIFLLNLLTGWSFIGWIIALIWASTHDRD